MLRKRVLWTLIYLTGSVTAQGISEIQVGLFTAAAALAVVMITIQGIRWVIADSPQQRAEAKQGLVWTVIGLIIAYLSVTIVYGVYCYGIQIAYGGTVPCP